MQSTLFKKLVSISSKMDLTYHDGMTCADYFRELDQTSAQFFLIQFVLKNTYIPRVMHNIYKTPAHIESAQTMLKNLQNPSNLFESFEDFMAEYLLLFLFLIDRSISAASFIHFNNYLSVLRHCDQCEALTDNKNMHIPRIQNSSFYTFSTDTLQKITEHFLDTPSLISIDAWNDIRCHYELDKNSDTYKLAFCLLVALSEQLDLTADDLFNVFSSLKSDEKLAIVLNTPKHYEPILFYTFQTHSLTLLSCPLEPESSHNSTLILHPNVVQSLIQSAVPYAVPCAIAPVLGRYNNDTAIRLATEKTFHPVSCWSSLISSNFYMAHNATPAGLFTTLHDECHLIVKQLIPEPLRDYFFKLGRHLQLISPFKKTNFYHLFELDFFNLLGLFNLKHLPEAPPGKLSSKHPLKDLLNEFEISLDEMLLLDRYTQVKLCVHYLIAFHGDSFATSLFEQVDSFILKHEHHS